MDLLDVLCAEEDEVLRSKIVSSIVHYLVDPHADHGLGAAVLREFMHDASTSWDTIDQALLDALACYPGIPDLDIEVAVDGGDGFAVFLRYETALFSLGFWTSLRSLPLDDTIATVSGWSHRLRNLSFSHTSVSIPRITKSHCGAVWIGPAAIEQSIVAGTTLDALHSIPWKLQGAQNNPRCRSFEEIVEAVSEQVAAGYIDDVLNPTTVLLRRLTQTVATMFPRTGARRAPSLQG